jgi:hypothetical protein
VGDTVRTAQSTEAGVCKTRSPESASFRGVPKAVCKPRTGEAAFLEAVRVTGGSEGAAVRVISHETASDDGVPLARPCSDRIRLGSGGESPLDVSRPLVEPLWIQLTYDSWTERAAPTTDSSFSLQKRLTVLLICSRPGAWPMHCRCSKRWSQSML